MSHRIAWLIIGNEPYGVRATVLNLTQTLCQDGWETPFISLTDGAFARECRADGKTIRCLDLEPPPRLDGSLAAKIGRFVSLRRYQRRAVPMVVHHLRQLNVEGVHVLWPNLVGIAGVAARRAGISCFWEMCNQVGTGYPFSLNRRVIQWQCWRSGIQPLANSQFVADTLGDDLVKPIVVRLGADPRRFDPHTVDAFERSRLEIPDEAILFGIFARIHQSKGQLPFLRAILSVDNHGPPMHLLLLGGPTESELAETIRRTAAEASAEGRVHFAGLVSDPERYFEMIDIVVNARTDAEPFGLSVIEAMLMRKPVLVHALGGPAETVIDDESGWHCPDSSVESFATGIRRAIDDRARWREMGERARARALEHYTSHRHAERYGQVVQERLAGLK